MSDNTDMPLEEHARCHKTGKPIHEIGQDGCCQVCGKTRDQLIFEDSKADVDLAEAKPPSGETECPHCGGAIECSHRFARWVVRKDVGYNLTCIPCGTVLDTATQVKNFTIIDRLK